MLQYILSLFSGVLYVQIWANRIRVHNAHNHLVFDEEPLIALEANKKNQVIIVAIGNKARSIENKKNTTVLNPFLHPRVLVNDFEKAEKILQHAVREVHIYKYLRPAPSIVIHPMEKLDGGLTDIEERVFRELSLGAGARKVAVHIGKELSVHDQDFKNTFNNLT